MLFSIRLWVSKRKQMMMRQQSGENDIKLCERITSVKPVIYKKEKSTNTIKNLSRNKWYWKSRHLPAFVSNQPVQES
jgi:hypothetical protein